jgi:hypothetical protein
MYFIDKESDLIGKEIAFTHFARFAEAMTIVTKDKGIFVFNAEIDEDDNEGISIYRAPTARRYILGDEWLRKQLNKLGIITNMDINL